MSTSPIPSASVQKRQRIPLALLDRMDSSRSLDEDNVGRLQSSIGKWGLMQSPVVIVNGARYLLCIGNHRCEALKRNGETEVECLVLPEGTSPQEALVRSLHENHVRHDECLADAMKRINALMEYHGCKSYAEAAKLAGISESKISKMRFATERLSPEALLVIQEQKIGWSVAYEVARHASSSDEQAAWLDSHVRGELPRDAVSEQVRKRNAIKREMTRATTPKRAMLRLRGKVGDIGLQLTVAPEANGRSVAEALVTVAKRLAEHVRAAQPLDEFAISAK